MVDSGKTIVYEDYIEELNTVKCWQRSVWKIMMPGSNWHLRMHISPMQGKATEDI